MLFAYYNLLNVIAKKMQLHLLVIQVGYLLISTPSFFNVLMPVKTLGPSGHM